MKKDIPVLILIGVLGGVIIYCMWFLIGAPPI